MGALLRVDGLQKYFGSLAAVDGVSFEVDTGTVFGIAGPNGAGKTSLFNAITGVPFHADSGMIEFAGRRVEKTSAALLCRMGVARTFQQVVSFDSMTVEENVRLSAVFGRAGSGPAASTVVEEALQFTDLAGVRVESAGALPLDARKRLMLASALATSPELLMLDEPAAGLHGPELARLHDLITAIRERGITVVMIEHVLPVLFGLSDRVMIMDAGHSISEGSPESVARDEAVIKAYLGEQGSAAFDAT